MPTPTYRRLHTAARPYAERDVAANPLRDNYPQGEWEHEIRLTQAAYASTAVTQGRTIAEIAARHEGGRGTTCREMMMGDDIGRPGGLSSDDGAAGVSTLRASIPDASDGESYRMNSHFRRFLGVVPDIQQAAVAWAIAKEAFAPPDPEAGAEYEVWQGDEMVAGCSGPRGRSLAEAVHYAVVYQTDDKPCVIQEVTRREVSPGDAHFLIASAMSAGTAETPQEAQGEARQRGGKAETPGGQS